MKKPNFSDICLLIPAYEPQMVLVKLVEELGSLGEFKKIIIVNDGSSKSAQPVFEVLQGLAGVVLLQHQSNQGKGEALKTGFRFVQQEYAAEIIGVVTLDADGQHLATDVVKIAEGLQTNSNKLILGVRTFRRDVPLRSRFGNVLTRQVFKLFFKKEITDTQTGLRGVPVNMLHDFMLFNAKGYEYELEELIHVSRMKQDIVQVPINTVYIGNNATSHFNPILDSLKIYLVFFRYLCVSLASYVIDISLFASLHSLGFGIFKSLVVARVASAIFNFYNNKITVYKARSWKNIKRELFAYILLAIFVIFISYGFIDFVVKQFAMNVILAKVLVDGLLFVFNFVVQQFIIFRRKVEVIPKE